MLFQQADRKTYQGYQEKYDQYDSDPLEESRFDLGLGKFIAADGTAPAVFGHLRRTIGTFSSFAADQITFLLFFCQINFKSKYNLKLSSGF
jgi:hypothetical protein